VRIIHYVLIHGFGGGVFETVATQEVTVTKTNTSKSSKTSSGPGKLSKTGKKAGVELTEAQLGHVAGGLKYKIV
jgi:hypothetical protein